MPRNVRNWWIETRVDGRDSEVTAGPVAKNGGFRTTIYMRDQGEVKRAVSIEGFVADDGTLRLGVWSAISHDSFQIRTER